MGNIEKEEPSNESIPGQGLQLQSIVANDRGLDLKCCVEQSTKSSAR